MVCPGGGATFTVPLDRFLIVYLLLLPIADGIVTVIFGTVAT
jgi:hypothetical protein